MNGAFYIGALGMTAQQRALDVVANNIANVNTPAFKRQLAQFSELVGAARDDADQPAAGRVQAENLSGVMLDSTPHVWSQGEIKPTGQPLDVAINGSGFLEVMGPAGRTLLTRGGKLRVDADGYLATVDGAVLKSSVSVPQGATNLTIDAQGTVWATVDAAPEPRQLGQIELAMVKDPDSLVDQGSGYYEASDPSQVTGTRAGDEGSGVFVQGALEMGNVQLTDEMVTLMLLQRAYAANAQVVQAGDQLMSIANELRR